MPSASRVRVAGPVILALAAALGAASAHATPSVVVNDRPLSEDDLRRLERLTCRSIPPGRYWFSLFSGQWGIEGDPAPRGHYRACCAGPCDPAMTMAQTR